MYTGIMMKDAIAAEMFVGFFKSCVYRDTADAVNDNEDARNGRDAGECSKEPLKDKE
jgi:hypothetical protein